MKRFIKFIFVASFVLGGWVLAAASLHVVRGPGTMLFGKVPFTIELIPKGTISFHDTYIDVSTWSVADVNAHSGFRDRLNQAGKAHLLKDALERPAPAPAPETKAAEIKHTTLTSVPADPQPVARVEPRKVEPAKVTTEVTPEVKAAPQPKSIFDFSDQKKDKK